MSTERQKEANQANAQKSTGPKTPEGKAKSSLNHFSHGFQSNSPVAPGEDPKQFCALLASLTLEHKPMTSTEQILVEKMASNQWLSLRAFRLQSEAFRTREDRLTLPKDLGLLIRYHSAAERAFHKAHTELVKVQKERQKSQIGFDPQNVWQPPQPVDENAPETVSSDVPDLSMDMEIHPEILEYLKNVA